jgi:hypothetical protein
MKTKKAAKTSQNHENLVNTAAVAAGVIPAPEQDATKPASKKASKAATPKKEAKPASKKTSKATASRKDAKPNSKKAPKATDGQPREGSKKQIVLGLLRRKDGATMAEIAKATDWQNHSIRGFISGQLTKRMGLTVESAKNEAGERTYRIAK